MPAFHRLRPGDTLYSAARAGGFITQVDVLEVDRSAKRARARIGVVGAVSRIERWMLDSELASLRRRRPPGRG